MSLRTANRHLLAARETRQASSYGLSLACRQRADRPPDGMSWTEPGPQAVRSFETQDSTRCCSVPGSASLARLNLVQSTGA